MLAFINSTHTKAEAVALAEWHKQQDSYMQNTCGKDTPEGWKGCSVGCMSKGKHKDYPKLFGIDARIAYLSDKLFESLPAPDYKDFTVRLFNSIQEGIDTKLVWYRFMYWMLSDAEHGVVKFNKSAHVIAVMELFKRAAEGEIVSRDEWEAAVRAANAIYATYATYAAYSAGEAAYAARNAAYAAAGYAANAAAYAADAAAYAAGYAATAARTRHYQIMADQLCYFLGGGIQRKEI